MNNYILIAGILCILLGLVHSVLGELLIFQTKRKPGHLVPTVTNSSGLRERHLRIIWASWHVITVFGWCIGAILIKIASSGEQDQTSIAFLLQSIVCTMFLSSILILIGTNGKHPGWIVFLVIGILLLVGG